MAKMTAIETVMLIDLAVWAGDQRLASEVMRQYFDDAATDHAQVCRVASIWRLFGIAGLDISRLGWTREVR